MNKKIKTFIIYLLIFSGGVFFEKQNQKVNKKPREYKTYSGIIHIRNAGDKPEIYLTLEDTIENIADSTDVFFKVNKIKEN